MKNISFLIGSGFSVQAGFPTTSQINEILKQIDASSICIHTSEDAWFLNGQNDPNAEWMRIDERRFVQEFLAFYNKNILKENEKFHYESFYDYYRGFLPNDKYPEDLLHFLTGFLDKYNLNEVMAEHDLLFKFNLTFNQLIAQLVSKPFQRCHLAKPYHPNCDAFLNLVELLSKHYVVNLHSLNHDLYIEHLSHSDSIQGKLDDGFEELGSPFYGELDTTNEGYVVRLARFTNKFTQPFRLYKLHGSINHYWYGDDLGMLLIKAKRGTGGEFIFKEIKNGDVFEYKRSLTNIYPDFLSGTTFKIRQYIKGNYYPTIFNHFKRNLESSNYLIVIGYGFGDNGINEYIKNSFFNGKDKKIFVVDLKEPDTDFLGNVEKLYIDGGMEGMNYQRILDSIDQ